MYWRQLIWLQIELVNIYCSLCSGPWIVEAEERYMSPIYTNAEAYPRSSKNRHKGENHGPRFGAETELSDTGTPLLCVVAVCVGGGRQWLSSVSFLFLHNYNTDYGVYLHMTIH